MAGGFPLGLEVCNAQDVGSNTGTSDGTTVTASGSTNTKGSWTQLIASTTYDCCWVLVEVNNAAAHTILVDIGVGAAASEQPVVNNLLASLAGSGFGPFKYIFPLQIPSGTRISARCQSSTASSTVTVKTILFDGAFTQLEGSAGVDTIGSSTASSTGTSVTPSTTTDTKGSYAQLVASAAQDYQGFSIVVSNGAASILYLLDVAIGGAGSEQVIVPNLSVRTTNGVVPATPQYIPIPIPKGTRVAARCQAHGTSAGALSLGLVAPYA